MPLGLKAVGYWLVLSPCPPAVRFMALSYLEPLSLSWGPAALTPTDTASLSALETGP